MNRHMAALVALFLLVLVTQAYFAFQADEISHDSYYHLRHVEHVRETFLPMYTDPLSYQGREYSYPPLFYYLIAFFSAFLPHTIKIMPILFFSSLVFLVYGTALNITGHRDYSLLAAVFYSFTPIAYTFPINNLSPFTLAVPLLFAVLFLLTQRQLHINILLASIVALVFAHPSSFLLFLGILLYVILAKAEGIRITKKDTEIIVFTMFLIFWSLFIIYKNVFLAYGLDAVWQNIPSALLESTFPELSVLRVVYLVGAIPFLLGAYAAYDAVFRHADKNMILILGFTFAVILLLWLRFLRLETGILYLAILFSILSAHGLRVRAEYIHKTRFYMLTKLSTYIIVLAFILSSVLPLYGSARAHAADTPSEAQINAFEWLKDNTAEGSTVLAPLKLGHPLAYFSERKTVIDTNFLLARNVNQRLRDVERIYKVRLQSEAVKLLDKYGADYIMIGSEAKSSYGVESLYYADSRCFTEVYNNKTKIYRAECSIAK